MRTWIGRLVALMAAAAFGALLVVISTDRIPMRDVQPPGCTRQDRTQPGCRVTRQRITGNSIALASVVVTPLATLVVALVAVGAARRRQDEQLTAEEARLTSRHEHELGLKRIELDDARRSRDRDALRLFLDQTATRIEEAYDAINAHILALKFPSDPPDEFDEYTKWVDQFTETSYDMVRKVGLCQMSSRQLDLRLPFEHSINRTLRQLIELLHDAFAPVPALPPISDDAEKACAESLSKVMATFRILTLLVQQHLAFDVGDDTTSAPSATEIDELLKIATTVSLATPSDS